MFYLTIYLEEIIIFPYLHFIMLKWFMTLSQSEIFYTHTHTQISIIKQINSRYLTWVPLVLHLLFFSFHLSMQAHTHTHSIKFIYFFDDYTQCFVLNNWKTIRYLILKINGIVLIQMRCEFNVWLLNRLIDCVCRFKWFFFLTILSKKNWWFWLMNFYWFSVKSSTA